MYKLYELNVPTKGAVSFVLIAIGNRGVLAPLMNSRSLGKHPHALYDVNGNLVSRTF